MLYLGNKNVKSSMYKVYDKNPFAEVISGDNVETFTVPKSVKFFTLHLNDENNNVDEYIFNDDTCISSNAFKDLTKGKITFNNVKYIGGIPNIESLNNLKITYKKSIEMNDELKLLTDYEIGDGTKYMYDGIEVLRNGLFQNKNSLTTITIPSTTKKIGSTCFQLCPNLSIIDMSNCSSLETIGSYAFNGCSAISDYDLSKCTSLKSIGSYCFKDNVISTLDLSGCSALTSLGSGCLEGCVNLTNVILPQSLTTIGSSCFAECINLTNVILPQSLTSLGSSCFANCQKIKRLDLSDYNNYEIFNYNTLTNSSIEELIFPSSLKTFSCRSSNVKSVDLSRCTLLSILGENSFYNCTSLTDVVFPPLITALGEDCFYGCTSLTDVVVPDSVSTFGRSAFHGCSSLTNLTFPASFVFADTWCFMDCSNLKIADLSRCTKITDFNGYMFSSTSFEEVVLPPSVTSVDFSIWDPKIVDLSRCTLLTSLPSRCFSNNSNLQRVLLPNSIKTLSSNCFYYCSSLSEITIPSSVTTIDSWCFDNCSSLKTITINKPKDSISGAPWGAPNATVIWNG